MSQEKLDLLKKRIDDNEFVNYNHIVIADVEETGATAYIDIVPETLNALGVAHGGAHYTLADTCAGYTSRADGRAQEPVGCTPMTGLGVHPRTA